ncbi:MAG: hypothetical protein K8T10_20085 [Candidatus Eremiobacteraeota bacterium]|nr:hypothetical protein [Candidatus Eremiobacteraeota bacterium]
MRKKLNLFSIILILILASIIIIYPVSAKMATGKKPKDVNAKYSAGGHNVHLAEPQKKHSIPAHIEMPLTQKGYHEATVHLDNSRKKIVSAHIRKPLVIEDYKGFHFTIMNAVYDGKLNSFVGHGEIRSVYLPGVLYASRIVFNKDGIQKVEKIRSKTSCTDCKIGGFSYTAEKITWTGDGIKSKGQLNLNKFHADITVLVTDKAIKLLKFHGPVHCLIEGRPAEITNLTLKGNRFYIDGNTIIFTGKTYRFKNVLVGPTGMIRANVPKVKRPKPYPLYKDKKAFLETPMDMIAGLAGLPGENLKQIIDTNMTMIITSADMADSNRAVSGYIPLPDPIKRVNVVDARIINNKVSVEEAEMKWQGKKIRVPIIHSTLSLKTPIELEEDEESGYKKLTAKADGILKIFEMVAPASKIYVDNYEIDYRVQPTTIPGTTLNSIGSYTSAFIQTEQKIQFDVIEAKEWIGFKCDIELGEMKFSPGNVSWFEKPLIEKPSLYFEIHSDGYIKVKITTGKECKIPIIPELLELENPGFFFLRQPGLITEFQISGTFLPPEAGDILKVKADFYLDGHGMYLCGGTGAEIYLFDMNVGDLQCAFASKNMQYTVEGDLKLFGYKFFKVNCRITLKPAGHRGSANLFQGSSGLRIPYPCHCWWDRHFPFFHCHTCHKTIGIKVWIHWNGHVGFNFGTYHFKMPHGTKQAVYSGPFKADGLEYDGTLIIDQKTGIQATGKDNIKSTSGHDSLSGSLSLKGSWLSEEMMTGTINSKVTVEIKPDLPYADEKVDFTFNNLKRKFVKNPQTGIWINVDPGNVNVQFDYTKDGNSQTFSKDCQLRMYISDSIMNIDLDLPAEFGGTYSQAYRIK